MIGILACVIVFLALLCGGLLWVANLWCSEARYWQTRFQQERTLRVLQMNSNVSWEDLE